ncbi:hypothetical protein GCM10022251_16040 [Phytohabitans flavus]|uniref:Glycosyltransferase RgtA/B/C/D-like domain-containing protein n=1 Tax=Phytohabitans flavus TaxID=1076124 RepID=A0A6F8Y6P2_9ACTN|nr:hypothetical protein [Phytohabitans flavus]BCB81648.1 hypothetical protein Pflav_080580 [Phytohabitans flavus]
MLTDRLRRWVRLPDVVLTGLLAVFVAARVFICVRGNVFTSFDTFSYAHRGDPAFDRGALLSLTGHAPRLWGVPLFYAIFPSDGARAVGQWAVGTVAWALLAWALWSCLRTLVARVVAGPAVLVVALLPQVANWDFAILSESLSISLGVLTLALMLLWARTASVWYLAGATAAAVWWTFTRTDIRVFVVFLVLALAVAAWRRPARRRHALVAAGTLVLATIWCTAITPVVDRTYTGWSATPEVRHEEGLMLFRLRLHVLPDAEVKAIFQREFGMPSCPGMEEIAAGPAWETAKFAAAYEQCPEFKSWGERNAADVWQRYAQAEPGVFARQTREVVRLSVAGSDYAKTERVVPAVVEKVVFPPRSLVLKVLGGALLLMAAALVFVVRRRPDLALTGAVVAVASGVSLLAGIWFGAGEYWRFGIQEAIGLRLAVLIAVVAVVDALLVARRDRARSAAQNAPKVVVQTTSGAP